mmetsp:Transcript_26688/g.73393  ORF Transcript_26688/g.73393 Transcript_26688/m.73393 type:complete len:215 (+) Transcript_26688:266-910(+)
MVLRRLGDQTNVVVVVVFSPSLWPSILEADDSSVICRIFPVKSAGLDCPIERVTTVCGAKAATPCHIVVVVFVVKDVHHTQQRDKTTIIICCRLEEPSNLFLPSLVVVIVVVAIVVLVFVFVVVFGIGQIRIDIGTGSAGSGQIGTANHHHTNRCVSLRPRGGWIVDHSQVQDVQGEYDADGIDREAGDQAENGISVHCCIVLYYYYVWYCGYC